MGKLYIPRSEPRPVWRFDSVGDLFAIATIFGLMFIVGISSCWEVIQ